MVRSQFAGRCGRCLCKRATSCATLVWLRHMPGCIAMATAAAREIAVWGRHSSSAAAAAFFSTLARSSVLLRIETGLLHGSGKTREDGKTDSSSSTTIDTSTRERTYLQIKDNSSTPCQLDCNFASLQCNRRRRYAVQQATPIRGAWLATRYCPSARCTTQPTCPTNSFRGCSDLGSLTGG